MDIRLDGKVALVTGASRGIGEAIAAEFLASGAAGVTITSRKQDNITAAAQRLDDPRVLPVVARADSEADAEAAVTATVAKFGSLDILVNNAGTNPAAGNLADVDLGAVAKTWEVNQLGPLLWSRAVWKHSMADGGGSIVNIASVGGIRVGPMIGAYNISKAAVIHLTHQLANEFAPAVRVNAVAPSVVRTRLAAALWDGIEEHTAKAHPLRRIGEPVDIANAVVFLASEAASWITGVILPVDGGVTGAAAAPGLGG
ncbi:MAG: SDR family oxidoreductase [Acidimicrobiia bacterium]|nr:SDR family oxidoreductase [Acidimicrobiia bacterium]MDX2467834.1 SDR family oxidoreductase [Acidimicrobiia bacterium]